MTACAKPTLSALAHRLIRVVRGNSKDVNIPPYDSDEFIYLTRRLRYGSDTERLQQELIRYPLDVQELSLKYLPAE